LLCLLLF